MSTEKSKRSVARDVMVPMSYMAIMLILDVFGGLFEKSDRRRANTKSAQANQTSFTLDHPS